MDDDKHYPPGSDAERQAAEEAAKQAEEAKAKAEAEAADKAKAEAEAAEKAKAEEAAKSEAEAKAKAEEDAKDKDLKKRSIYDDDNDDPNRKRIYEEYKERKQELKSERAAREAAEAKVAELQALLDKKAQAETPAEKKEAAKDLKEYAEKHKLDPAGLEELRDLILKDIPDIPEGLSKEELEEWRTDRARRQRDDEDRAIDEQADGVRAQMKQLGFEIHVDAEAKKVMAEIKRLAHKKEFHDKPVEYIVWANREALSKLVSPKKPSFEAGGQPAEGAAEVVTDFGDASKVTPEIAQKAQERPKSTYEIRRAQ